MVQGREPAVGVGGGGVEGSSGPVEGALPGAERAAPAAERPPEAHEGASPAGRPPLPALRTTGHQAPPAALRELTRAQGFNVQ